MDAQYLAELATAPPPLDIPSGAELKGDDPYIVFVGRVDPSKGCDQLFEYFLRFKSETGNPIKLVLVGKPTMVIPKHPDVVSVGFTKDDPFHGLHERRHLCFPRSWRASPWWSLSRWGWAFPVLVNGDCDVCAAIASAAMAGYTTGATMSLRQPCRYYFLSPTYGAAWVGRGSPTFSAPTIGEHWNQVTSITLIGLRNEIISKSG